MGWERREHGAEEEEAVRQRHSNRRQGGTEEERSLGARRAYRRELLTDSRRNGAPRAAQEQSALISPQPSLSNSSHTRTGAKGAALYPSIQLDAGARGKDAAAFARLSHPVCARERGPALRLKLSSEWTDEEVGLDSSAQEDFGEIPSPGIEKTALRGG